MEKLMIYKNRWSTSTKEWYQEHISDLEVTQEIRDVNELLDKTLDDETHGRQPKYEWSDLEAERDQKILELLTQTYGGAWEGGLETIDDKGYPMAGKYKNTAGTHTAILIWS